MVSHPRRRRRAGIEALAGQHEGSQHSFMKQNPSRPGISFVGWLVGLGLALSTSSAPGDVIWREGFEQGLGNWSVEGELWRTGPPQAPNGPAPFEGAQVAGTGLTGNYGRTHDARLISPEFIVPASTERPRLTFKYWYLIGANDVAQVQIRRQGGAWVDVEGQRLTEASGGSWARSSLDLTAEAGQTVQVAFRLVAAWDNRRGDLDLGWFVDDVALETGKTSLAAREGFENGFGGWSVEGGVWQVGKPLGAGAPTAFAGTNVAGTILAGTYGTTHDARLISPSIHVPEATAAPRFTYHYWYALGAGDFAQLQFRTPGGTWQDLAGERLTEANGGSWVRRSVDLRAFAGTEVQFAFRLSATYDNRAGDLALGWYLDEVGIETGPMRWTEPESFENGFGDWSVEGGVWQVGTPSGTGAPSAFIGTNVVGTILAGHYGTTHDARLVSPEFVVPPAPTMPRLRYQYWYTIGGLDYGQVQFREIGGAWQDLVGERLTETGGTWARRRVDLRTLAGKSVQLAFRLVANYQNRAGDLALGWYLDEVALETGPMTLAAAEGFEQGFSDWSAEGGVWQVGVPSGAGAPPVFAGAQVAGTILAGNHYGTTHDARLVTPEFEVPSANQLPRFSYYNWHALGVFDHGQLQVRTAGGAWQDIVGERLVGTGGAWTRRSVDLRAFAGQRVELAFRLVAEFQNRVGDLGRGWFIDQAGLETGPMNLASPEGFENGFGDWSVEGGVWQIGPPTAVGGPKAYAGNAVAGTVLNGNYPDQADVRLVSPEFVVPPATRAPQFSIRQWRALAGNDRGRIEVSLAGGTWSPVSEAFTGADTVWRRTDIDLSPYSGQSVRLAMHLTSDAQGNAAGWYLDEARVGALDPETLPLGGWVNGRLAAAGSRALYVLEAPPGGHLRLVLDDLDDLGANEIYVRRGAVPTAGSYDGRFTGNGADQTLFVPDAGAGPWYVLLVGARVPDEGSSYRLRAEYSEGIALAFISPTRLGTLGRGVLELSGAGFDDTVRVELRMGATLHATGQVVRLGGDRLRVQFAVTNLAVGAYEIAVVQDGHVATLPLEVFAGGTPRLETHLFVPSRVGRHAPAVLQVEYANTGDIAMPAPLLVVHGSDRALLTLDASLGARGLWASAPPRGYSDTIQILGSGATPGVLQPGERQRVPVYYAGLLRPWSFADNAVVFDLRAISESNRSTIDWNVLKSRVRPVGTPPAGWDVIWSHLTAGIGYTWGDYVARLNADAVHLGGFGSNTRDVFQLLTFELAQADGLNPVAVLSSATDVDLPAPGLPLVFGRVYPHSISQRHRRGPHGMGWSHNWEIRVQSGDDGTVWVAGPGGVLRFFQPDSRGGFFRPAGDFGRLVRLAAGRFQLTEPDGINLVFRADGRLETIADLNTNTITASYVGDQLAALTHSSGQALRLVHSDGLLRSLTDPYGRVTEYDYDAASRLIAVTQYGSNTLRYTYGLSDSTTPDPTLTRVVYPDGARTDFSYDPRGRLQRRQGNGGAEALAFEYPSPGTVSVIDALGNSVRCSYDARGLLAQLEDPLGRRTRLTVGGNQRLSALQTPAGTWALEYDRSGNLTRAVDALGQATSLNYSPQARPTQLVDARRQVTRMNHDTQGNPIGLTDPAHRASVLTNDARGSVVAIQNRRGQVIQLTRDALGRVTRKVLPEGVTQDFLYDARGNLTQITDSAQGTTRMEYDLQDRLASLTYPDGQGFSYTYSDGGRRLRRRTHDGQELNYAYDALGRLERVEGAAGRSVVRYEYDPTGRLRRETRGNGTSTSYDYDAAGQLTALVHAAADMSPLSRFEYAYDAAGRRVRSTGPAGTTTYVYDAPGQLTEAVSSGGRRTTYAYDAVGNRTAVTEDGQVSAYTLGDLNQYVQAGGLTCAYDLDGNLIRRTDAEGSTQFQYDSQNRITDIDSPKDGTWHFEYDALGQRVSSTHDGRTTRLLHDPFGNRELVAEYDASGVAQAWFEHGIGLVSRANAVGVRSHFHFDALGSARLVTDPDGKVLLTQDYDAFGRAPGTAAPTTETVGFIGRWGVQATGGNLYLMGKRGYDPAMGRFISEDPLGFAGGDVNLYRYARNAPTLMVDPLGTSPESDQELQDIRGLVDQLQQAANQAGKGSGWRYIGWDLLTSPWNPAYLKCVDWQASVLKTLGGVPGPYEHWEIFRGTERGWNVPWTEIYTYPHFFVILRNKDTGEYWKVDPWWLEDGQDPVRKIGPDPGDDHIFCYQGTDPYDINHTVKCSNPTLATAEDPNELLGPAGFGPDHYVPAQDLLPYRINFENATNATAPAQVVLITNALAPELNLDTLEFTSVGFGDHFISIPAGVQHFEHVENLTLDGTAFEVHIEVRLDPVRREVLARFDSVMPDTGLPPMVDLGFLPPEDGTGRGNGHVAYIVRPKTGLPTGTEIRNIGVIQFDPLAGGKAYRTDLRDPTDPDSGIDPQRQALVTLDGDAPIGRVEPLPATRLAEHFEVRWSGTDSGAGVQGFDVYARVNDGEWALWLHNTSETSASWSGDLGHVYGFIAVARDAVGHEEEAPTSTTPPEAQIMLEEFAPGRLELLGFASGRLDLRIVGSSGTVWALERASDATGPWTRLETLTLTVQGSALFSDPSVPNAAFYRARKLP